MRRFALSTLAMVVVLAGASAAFAGGENCRKNAKVAQAGYEACESSAEECLSAMAAKIASKGWVGFETEKNTYGHYEVVRVEHGSPAEAAGFHSGDILVAMNGLDLYAEDKAELKRAKQSLVVGSAVSYTVKRDGTKKTLEVTLSKVPPRIMAQWIGEHMLDQHAHIEVAAAG